jgi:hypothetical protein
MIMIAVSVGIEADEGVVDICAVSGLASGTLIHHSMQVQHHHAQHRPKRSFTASDGSRAYILPF